LTLARDVAEYFEATTRACGNAKAASNWVMTEVLRMLKDDERSLDACPVPPERLGRLICLVEDGTLSGRIAKDVLAQMWASGEDPDQVIAREGLRQVSDEGALTAAVQEVLRASPEQVETYRGGKSSTLGWFVGQVMRRTGGKANPQVVTTLLKRALDRE
jgi:aspartyl-tRNA(Asn)/glutamyl-tRNA(Gln) amidotransferase subunit B